MKHYCNECKFGDFFTIYHACIVFKKNPELSYTEKNHRGMFRRHLTEKGKELRTKYQVSEISDYSFTDDRFKMNENFDCPCYQEKFNLWNIRVWERIWEKIKDTWRKI